MKVWMLTYSHCCELDGVFSSREKARNALKERVENDEDAISYVKNNIDLIWRKNPVYQHGDFHPGNLIYMPDGQIGVIDFNRWEVGDPYEEFYKLEIFNKSNNK